jgi:molecular chaperone DnaK (HSP70)
MSSKSDLVIAIDFGTTYTGVAYAYSPRNQGFTNPEQIRDKITVVKSWRGVGAVYSEKTPTTLAYEVHNDKPIAWGGQVKQSHPIIASQFKLGLQKDAPNHYRPPLSEPGAKTSPFAQFFQSDRGWKHPDLPNKKPSEFVADYLNEVRQFIVNTALPNDFGDKFLRNITPQYVLTVPAIWRDKAKDLTKKAAVRAGIPLKDLTLVSEPEAAALYCATLCREVELEDGDHFVICDADGGTVVLSISCSSVLICVCRI